MANLEWLVEDISSRVRGGLTPEQAYKKLCEVFDEPDVLQALREFEKRTGRIRQFRRPPSIIDPDRLTNWYVGSSPDDIFWPHLKNYLLQKPNWTEDAVDSVDQASDKIVSLLQPPGRASIDTRGLVVGYVQSGKTANFTAAVAKAADVGYKLFIVLSGVTDNLRNQTQQRLDKELVGSAREHWVWLTEANRDFRPGAVQNVNAFLTDYQNLKVIGVVKKNAGVLRRLLTWLRSATREVLSSCPVLMIDDEADQASINTSRYANERTRINQLLRDILSTLPRAAYVGYTATPFANVFIDPSDHRDLYPRDFIITLPEPVGYFGAERIFGRERLVAEETDEEFNGLDMIRIVPDEETPLLKPKFSERHDFIPTITASLKEAVHYFWLAVAARHARGQSNEHSTMLIHTTLYVAVHNHFQQQVENFRHEFLRNLRNPLFVQSLREQWEDEAARVQHDISTSFDEISGYLALAAGQTIVVVDNYRSPYRLSYDGNSKIQIVIGGNTLSRGLTLEGLIVSFFVRAADAYDTLLQMGRWFGYRHEYSDLPRIWMSAELEGWFYDLATVEEEVRCDIQRYQLEGITPLEFGVRVRTHPDLNITSQLKMQHAVPAQISYSDHRVQTRLFYHKDEGWLKGNIEAAGWLADELVASVMQPERRDGHCIFYEVPVEIILRFLNSYQSHPNSVELRSELLRGYIQAQNSLGQLQRWNVVVRGAKDERTFIPLGKHLTVPLLQRSRRSVPNDYANIGVLMSRGDIVADLEGGPEMKKLDENNLKILRNTQLPSVGLLLLYPISKDSAPNTRPDGEAKETRRSNYHRVALEAVDTVMGVGLVFPKAAGDGTPQSYMTVDMSAIEREEIEWDFDAEDASK
ncbi:MAG: hypothetical protein KJ064_06155 [Anaerolineae bacterium]|nr:hypothetical protein [Anaerolineae bacterium]